MILQALNDYYRRLQTEGLADVAAEGFQKQPVPFVIVVNRQGRFTGLLDTRTGDGKKKEARRFTVPKGVKKTSGIAANLLWDVPTYVLGRSKADPKKDPAKLAERAAEQHRCFIDTIRERLAAVLCDEGVSAVLSFSDGGSLEEVFCHPAWPEIEENGLLLSFQLEGDTCLVCERAEVVKALAANSVSRCADRICLISGEPDETARLHTAIKGVYGAQSSGS